MRASSPTASPGGHHDVAQSAVAISNNNGEPHDYNQSARDFTVGADFEKTQLAKELKIVFEEASHKFGFDPSLHQVLDYGSGPGLMALPVAKEEIRIDCYDPSPNMIEQARITFDTAEFDKNIRRNRLVTDTAELEQGSYKIVMVNFVHQCISTKKELSELFRKVRGLLRNDGVLVVMGAHPDYLHVPHAGCHYNVANSADLEDGDKYTGFLRNTRGKPSYMLNGDYFWKINTLHNLADVEGFEEKGRVDIADFDTLARSASRVPAYFRMTFVPHRSPALTGGK